MRLHNALHVPFAGCSFYDQTQKLVRISVKGGVSRIVEFSLVESEFCSEHERALEGEGSLAQSPADFLPAAPATAEQKAKVEPILILGGILSFPEPIAIVLMPSTSIEGPAMRRALLLTISQAGDMYKPLLSLVSRAHYLSSCFTPLWKRLLQQSTSVRPQVQKYNIDFLHSFSLLKSIKQVARDGNRFLQSFSGSKTTIKRRLGDHSAFNYQAVVS